MSHPIYQTLHFSEFIKLPIKTFIEDERAFEKFLWATYATKVTFQESYRISGIMQERRENFSGKHKLRPLKIDVSVCGAGHALFFSYNFPESVAYIDIFYHNIDFKKFSLQKIHFKK